MKQRFLSAYRRARNGVLAASWLLIGYGWWSSQMRWLLVGGLLLNLYAAVMMAKDKQYAKEGRFRIPESSLLLIAGLGGAAGTWAVMMLYRHKTKHPSFMIAVPLFFIIQMVLLVFAFLNR
ncbi:DUF1294 domain-containing protein [Brevibacillus ruminantium]|uniref:DUF1294 domain-containing protein n=1 Tax=Brevibacillus ruminantium TaxID=2950604 RepID=A0ABY4WBK4_9BACL|nr:DUF1294 domain-containing protein [Brevibacillus ruminantium]USG64284.1 DUF1294 domain-containing protein [Brevibacillus ruminantium]